LRGGRFEDWVRSILDEFNVCLAVYQ
jgi:hypothetical protein